MFSFRVLSAFVTVTVCTVATVAWAAQSPVFEYSFPASYDGATNDCVDLSSANHDGLIDGMGAAYAAGVVPPGFAPSLGSLDGANLGYGQTKDVDLLANNKVSTYGGFTFDTWIQPMSYGTRDPWLFDYGGSEGMNIARSGSDGDYTYRFRFRARDGWWNIYSDPIDLTRWYHVRLSFDSIGLPALSTGEQPGLAVMVVDDVDAGVTNTYYAGMVKTTLGDRGRPMGVGRHAVSTAYHSNGFLFNPKVFLGPDPTIDASSLITPPAGVGNTVAHWKLDDMVGATAILDSGPHGFVGEPTGEPMLARPGARPFTGTAVGFNLDLGSDDVIDVPRDELLTSESFSVALWLKPMAEKLAGTAWQIPIDNRGAGTTGWSLTIGPAGDAYKNQIYAMIGAGPASWSRMLSSPLEGDEWTHVAMTYDAETRTGRLYVDGELASLVVTDYVRNEVNPLRLGRHNISNSNAYSGDLDDIWMFDYALTQDQIAMLIPEPGSFSLIFAALACLMLTQLRRRSSTP